MRNMPFIHRWLWLIATLLAASTALAAVRHEGTWPEKDPSITIDLSAASRVEAVRKVAEAAGWNVVFKGLPEDRIDVHVKNQPASRVLDLVLSDAGYVARRDGDLIQIEHDHALPVDPTPSAPSAPSVSSASPQSAASSSPQSSSKKKKKNKHHDDKDDDEARDRTVFGGTVRVEKAEIVDDVSVFGGTVDIWGKATGSVTVFGGAVHVYDGAHVEGDLTVIGGSALIDDGATVDGDLVALGGDVTRGNNAEIGGEVKLLGDEKDHDDDSGSKWEHPATHFLRNIGKQITKTAFLFVIGAVVIAIATRRMQLLQSEITLRPMRSMALGIAALVSSVVLAVLLCVTIVGIPVALAGIVIGLLAAYAGICAALTAMGSAIVAHRSENPYVHLAVGCGVFLVAGFIPYFGSFVTVLILFAGLGAFAATRGAGFIPANR
ncbi:MAG: polymer-forming cytoskeletal protein [Polyangiaceae bacterium]